MTSISDDAVPELGHFGDLSMNDLSGSGGDAPGAAASTSPTGTNPLFRAESGGMQQSDKKTMVLKVSAAARGLDQQSLEVAALKLCSQLLTEEKTWERFAHFIDALPSTARSFVIGVVRGSGVDDVMACYPHVFVNQSLNSTFFAGYDGRYRKKREKVPDDALPYDLSFNWTGWRRLAYTAAGERGKTGTYTCKAPKTAGVYEIAVVCDGNPTRIPIYVGKTEGSSSSNLFQRLNNHASNHESSAHPLWLAIQPNVPYVCTMQVRFRVFEHAYQAHRTEQRILQSFDYFGNTEHNGGKHHDERWNILHSLLGSWDAFADCDVPQQLEIVKQRMKAEKAFATARKKLEKAEKAATDADVTQAGARKAMTAAKNACAEAGAALGSADAAEVSRAKKRVKAAAVAVGVANAIQVDAATAATAATEQMKLEMARQRAAKQELQEKNWATTARQAVEAAEKAVAIAQAADKVKAALLEVKAALLEAKAEFWIQREKARAAQKKKDKATEANEARAAAKAAAKDVRAAAKDVKAAEKKFKAAENAAAKAAENAAAKAAENAAAKAAEKKLKPAKKAAAKGRSANAPAVLAAPKELEAAKLELKKLAAAKAKAEEEQAKAREAEAYAKTLAAQANAEAAAATAAAEAAAAKAAAEAAAASNDATAEAKAAKATTAVERHKKLAKVAKETTEQAFKSAVEAGVAQETAKARATKTAAVKENAKAATTKRLGGGR